MLVSNHSGGTPAYDVPLLAVAFSEEFGDDRPLCTLAHDLIFIGQGDAIFRKFGFLPANPRNAVAALQDGMATLVFPGGDWDAMRPTETGPRSTSTATRVTSAQLWAGVPIVPIVTIGGQETQLFLNDGAGLAKFLRLDKLIRAQRAPLVLRLPVRPRTRHDAEPSAAFQDGHPGPRPDRHHCRVRRRPRHRRRRRTHPFRMQAALDELSDERRFPIIG